MVMAVAWLTACTPQRAETPVVTVPDNPPQPTWLPAEGQAIRWRALLVGGDNREAAFDNAARGMAAMLQRAGIPDSDIVVLSAYERAPGRNTEFASIRAAADKLSVKPGDGCLVFVTAHGSQGGLYLRGTNSYYYLSPSALHGILAHSCKQAPTIVVASGCFSGVFAAKPMLAPNRVIYTASRSDRRSFGCDAQLEFTFFDYCFLSSLPDLADWAHLAQRTANCVKRRELKQNTGASEPQFALGTDLRDVLPPSIPRQAISDIWRIVPPLLKDANSLPLSGPGGQKGLREYKAAALEKALAVAPHGGWSWRAQRGSQHEAAAAALEACRKSSGENCLLYALGDKLVWHESLREALLPGSPANVRLVQAD